MTSEEQTASEFEEMARQCGRLIYAYHAGAFCQNELFTQLEILVPTGREQELIAHLPPATIAYLNDLYQSDQMVRDGYYSRFRMHLAICDSGIVKSESD